MVVCSLLLAISCSETLFAAREAVTSSSLEHSAEGEQQRMWSLLESVYQRLQLRAERGGDMHVARQILTEGCETRHPEAIEAYQLRAQAEEEAEDLGLRFNGSFSSGKLTDDDEPTAYLELSWDVLRQGYRANSNRAEALYREARLAELRGEMEAQKREQFCRRYALARSFAGLKSQLLTLNLEITEPIYKIERRAYFKGWSLLDDFLVSESELDIIRRELAYLHSSPEFDANIVALQNPPVIDVDMVAIAEAVRNDERLHELSLTEQQALEYYDKAAQKSRLRLFLRSEFDRPTGDNYQTDLVAGLRFSIPLDGHSEEPLRYGLLRVREEAELQAWERLVRARGRYVEVREQMERVVAQQYRYIRAYERIRRSMAAHALGDDDNLAVTITRMRTALAAAVELVQAKEELYRRVNEVLRSARLDFNPDYIQVSHLHSDRYRAREGERSIYLWSKAFNETPNSQILDFLVAKGVNGALLSGGRKTDAEKAARFLESARRMDISVESVVGEKEWVLPGQHARAAVIAAVAAERTGAVHLDVEPQVFDDFKEHKEAYIEDYVTMLRAVRETVQERQLSVALPVYWSAQQYHETGVIADDIYLMAYGSDKPEVVARRLAVAFGAIPLAKIVVALRVDDFEDEWAMEQMVDELRLRLGVRRFAWHQFGSFVK